MAGAYHSGLFSNAAMFDLYVMHDITVKFFFNLPLAAYPDFCY